VVVDVDFSWKCHGGAGVFVNAVDQWVWEGVAGLWASEVCDGLFMLRGYYERQQRLKGNDRPLHMLQRLTKLFAWSSLLQPVQRESRYFADNYSCQLPIRSGSSI
jgi:hypothetical protein